ncbi:MAG: diaminopimelate epimerase [Alphaproteobacteria bacterium]
MDALPFVKMHGLGNDFVIIDARGEALTLAAAQVRAIADRRTGVGCDQLITIEPAADADAFMRIHNADGGEAEACGNGARCVARLLMDELGRAAVTLETVVGHLDASADGRLITVDMGPVQLDWGDIPLSEETNTLHLRLGSSALGDGVASNIGNPHLTFFVEDAETADIASYGSRYETHPLFPRRVNVAIASVTARGGLRLRVWERGVGITRACGSAACAATTAASRRGLIERRAEVTLDGGTLDIEWRADNHVAMTGPTAVSFRGRLDPSLLAADD